MFRKLKIQLILINLILTGLVLVTIFSGIYILMDKSFDNAAYMRMFNIGEIGRIPPQDPHPNRFGSSEDIIVRVDNNGKIKDIFSNYSLSTENINEIVKEIFNTKENKGTLTYDEFVLRYVKVEKNYGYVIVFSDKSFDNEVLKRLIIISIIVCTVSLIFVLIISLILANIALKPIINAWEKERAFVADASHELRTPLSVITTNLDIITDRDNENETIKSQAKWLNNIKLETKMMTKLIQDLLFLARTDSGKQSIEFFDFDLSSAVLEAIIPFEAVAIKNRINLTHKIEPNINFNGDKGRIKQLIAILVDNAIKHTNGDGSVNVDVHRSRNKIEMIVSDTGEGIPEEHINKIFDRFYKVDKSRSKRDGNFGLGLAIAKSIVKEHKGNISVSSVVGKGTTFKIVV
ncbi:ATP-binding protein [Clostridium sp. cel8]|jgi:two-component system, OmpR family, sensor histidine kinase CiaH|uniref:sensor histidine kinase n=1 Tax=Clostridium sp. cel8 TaxID=2663123 RepID=UPI0015F754A4|nr:ATP-binding protein [Clostridium sp. cel8]MBA5850687.1 ATP-binding protein [Clostridium sp. cel8]